MPVIEENIFTLLQKGIKFFLNSGWGFIPVFLLRLVINLLFPNKYNLLVPHSVCLEQNVYALWLTPFGIAIDLRGLYDGVSGSDYSLYPFYPDIFAS